MSSSDEHDEIEMDQADSQQSRALLFEQRCGFIEETSADYNQRSEHCKILNELSFLCEEARELYLQSCFSSLEYSESFGASSEEYISIIGDHYFLLLQLCVELLKSRNSFHRLSAMRFLGSCLPPSSISPEVRENSDHLCSYMEGDDLYGATLATSVTTLIALRDRVFLDELCGNASILEKLCERLEMAHDHLKRNLSTPSSHTAAYPPDMWTKIGTDEVCAPVMGESFVLSGDSVALAQSDSEQWGADMWAWVASQSLSLLATLADVLDVLGVLLTHNVLDRAIFLVKWASCSSEREGSETCRSPLLAWHGCRLLEKAVAHRRLACDFIDKDGIDLLLQMTDKECSPLVDAHTSGCLSTLVSHAQAMEKLIRRRKGEVYHCLSLAVRYIRRGSGFLCRQHAVLCMCEALSYRPSVSLLDSMCGLDDLFLLLRACVLHERLDGGGDDEKESVSAEEEEDEGDDDEVGGEGRGGGGEAEGGGAEGSSHHPSVPSSDSQLTGGSGSSGGEDMYFQCLDEVASTDSIVELRDDLLRATLTYLRVSAFLDLEAVSPGSVSLMCGGLVPLAASASQQQQQVQETGRDTSGIGAGVGSSAVSMSSAEYTSITFDDEGSCTGAAEGLLHALREVAMEYNDLQDKLPTENVCNEDGCFTPASVISSLESVRRPWSEGGINATAAESPPLLLLWCVPVRMPPINYEQPIVITKPMLGRPHPQQAVPPSGAGGGGGLKGLNQRRSTRYFPVREVLRRGYLHLLLYILSSETKSSRRNNDAIMSLLHILELLALNPSVIEQMCLTVHVVGTLPEQGAHVAMSDVKCSLNGVGIVLDMLAKKTSLLTAQALNLLRSLVTPPHFLLLPPYTPPDEVELLASATHQRFQQTGRSFIEQTPHAPPLHTQMRSDDETRSFGGTPSAYVSTPYSTSGRFDVIPDTGDFPPPVRDGPEPSRSASPTSTVFSKGFTHTAMLIERAQKHARNVARRCNGIQKLVAVLESSLGNTLYVYNIRLGLVQVLLGMAHDTLICALLTRLSLDQTISSITLPAFAVTEAWNAPGAKCLKRIFTSMKLCSPKLVALINGSGSSRLQGQGAAQHPCRTATEALMVLMKQDNNTVDRGASVDHVENALIAAKTQINFDKGELLELVGEFLAEEGLLDTVKAMQREIQKQRTATAAAGEESGQSPASTVASPTPIRHSSWTHFETPFAQRNYRSPAESVSGADVHGTGVKRRAEDRKEFTAATATADQQVESGNKKARVDSPVLPTSQDQISSASDVKAQWRRLSITPASKPPLSQRKKMIKEAIRAPSLLQRDGGSSSALSTTRRSRSLPSASASHRKSTSLGRRSSGGFNGGGNVTLTSIVTSYLRQQHQQCQFPISVVPKFSLFSKHKCSAPEPASLSMWDVLQQRRLFGDKVGRMRSYAEEDLRRVDCSRILKHRVYSEYRQWRVFGEVTDDLVTSATFSADSRKVWIGGGEDRPGLDQGGSLRVHDIYSTQQLGFWELDRSIDSVSAPSRLDVQLLLTTSGLGDMMDRRVTYTTNVWRAGVRASGIQSADEFFLDHNGGPLVQWENLTCPVFSPSCTNVCGIPSPSESNSSGRCAVIFDTESGVGIESFRRNSLSMGTYSKPYSSPNACYGLGIGGENIVLAAGALWDCRTGGLISDFDKLSSHGCGVFHPNGNCLLIDNAVWDMRRFCLLETVKLLENGAQAHFCTDGNGSVLFGYTPFSLDEYIGGFPLSRKHSVFHALDASDYSHIHTQEVDSEDVVFWGGVQSDPCGLGYLLSVEMRCDQFMRRDDSYCRIREIGRRKPNYQDDDADDAQTEDDEWDNEETGEEDEEEGGDLGEEGFGEDVDRSSQDTDFYDDEDDDEEGGVLFLRAEDEDGSDEESDDDDDDDDDYSGSEEEQGEEDRDNEDDEDNSGD